jgi:membrane protease YdiL (CAAX protease family)
LQTPENGVSDAGAAPLQREAADLPRPVAPAWHTLVLIAGVILLSIAGAKEMSGGVNSVDRLHTYALTVATEVFMLAWVYFGLRLRRIPFRSLLGSIPGDFRSIAVDLGIAMVFWMGSLIVLGTIGIFWTVIEAAITHRSLFPSGKSLAPDASQQQSLHTLLQLAPANGREIAAWIAVCIIAGIVEEIVFRGYLQRQFTAWARGAVAAGVAGSALLFGFAHGYQGARSMVLLCVFGVLFSLLALFRRSLRAGIIAHSWQDICAGLMLALLKAHHML